MLYPMPGQLDQTYHITCSSLVSTVHVVSRSADLSHSSVVGPYGHEFAAQASNPYCGEGLVKGV